MSLRRSLAAAGVALMLSSGLIAGAPATATASAAAPRYDEDRPRTWGITRAPDQVLKAGCHRYRYRYRIDVPNWAAEIFLVTPRGRIITHDVIFNKSEPRKAWRRWSTDICRRSAVYGRYKIKMKITWVENANDPTPDNVDGWVRPSTFRMKRP